MTRSGVEKQFEKKRKVGEVIDLQQLADTTAGKALLDQAGLHNLQVAKGDADEEASGTSSDQDVDVIDDDEKNYC